MRKLGRQSLPVCLLDFRICGGPTSKGRDGNEMGKGGMRKEGKSDGGEGKEGEKMEGREGKEGRGKFASWPLGMDSPGRSRSFMIRNEKIGYKNEFLQVA